MPQIVLAATQAAALAPAVAPAVIAPAATGLGAAAANTAAIELAKQKAIEAGTQQLGQQVAQQATQQIGQQAAQQATQQATQQLGQQAANQGIAQASQQATQQLGQQALTQTGQEAAVEAAKQTGVEGMKQGIFSANPAGMPPTAGPITPTGPLNPATPLPPAGGTPPMSLEQQLAQIQANPTDLSKFPQYEQVATAGSNTPLVEKAAGPVDPTKNPFAPFKSNVPVRENMLAYKEALPNFQTAQNAKLQAQISNLDGGLGSEFLKTVPPPEKNALKEGIQAGLDFMNKNPVPTGLGLMSAGQYLNQPEEEDEDKYKNTVDMSEFKPSIPTQRPFTRSYEYQSYQAGGPVEDMSRMNSLGANTGFPMARLQTPAYAVSSATPMPVNTLTPTADASVNAYTGEPRFAEGGLSAAQRREYGLKTRGQRAAQNLTKTFEEMEEERQKEAMRLFGERFDPGIIRRSRTQELSSPFSAAMAEHARLGKKAKVPVVEMPKTNLGDIDNYMDIPIDAANGGIMRGKDMNFAGGGETQYGITSNRNHVNPENQYRSEIAGGRRPTPAAPVMSAPKYNAPAQQASYAPISYQDGSSYQMPAQQSDMSDFYNYMNQQLANYGDYGFAAGGGIMGGSHLGGYSDGGRLLRGPGDGVSDSIPAVIGKRQPARLADGEFVVPARIVSELGNGSTEAGARKLYAMMERVQRARKKSIGKKKVAVNSKADKHLPA